MRCADLTPLTPLRRSALWQIKTSLRARR
uniref:Mre11B n=1 Tax=Arundo donax TaxID=35708 RepID=A0A0A9CF10_ARUDO